MRIAAAQWIELPNGNYRVIVSTFDWGDATETNSDLPAYTFEFQPVTSLDDIPYPTTAPVLLEGEGLTTNAYLTLDGFERGVIPLLPCAEVVFPIIDISLPLTQRQYQQYRRIAPEVWEQADWAIAVSSNSTPQSIATLIHVAGLTDDGGNSSDNRWTYRLNAAGEGLIKILRIFDNDGIQWAEVERYEPPTEAVSTEQIEQLKLLFADYAERNAQYQQRVAYPSFYAEQVASLSNSRSLSWQVANAMVLPLNVQQELLVLSDRDRIQRLTDIVRSFIL
ncbi:MAG: hypothetical protein SFY66_21610 [Oculatellaceae cyanobacterium bins.114]|nr:hypothetical protein [Oculatellaceae cyanobacterium bins.114]